MSDQVTTISERERQELAGALGSFVYTFFLNQESVSTVAGNRRAAEKASQVIGRLIAAATYPDKLDTSYLMMSRRFEVVFAEAAMEAADTVIKNWIKPV